MNHYVQPDTGFLEESILLKHKYSDCRILVAFIIGKDRIAKENETKHNNNENNNDNNSGHNNNEHSYFDSFTKEFTMFKNFTMKEFSILKHWLTYDN